jgi:hypothetical protein
LHEEELFLFKNNIEGFEAWLDLVKLYQGVFKCWDIFEEKNEQLEVLKDAFLFILNLM